MAGLLFGLTPALQATHPKLVPALKGEGQVAEAGRRGIFDLRSALLVAQIALSVLALTGAGLFLRSLHHALELDPGFDTRNLIVMSLDLGAQGYDRSEGRQFHRRLDERLRGLPGVQSYSVASNRPLMPGAIYREVVVEGAERPDGRQERVVRTNTVGPDYFGTVGIQILKGRSFQAEDREDTANVAVINQTMAERLWPDRDPLGRRFRIVDPAGDIPYQVVGVAADSKYTSLGEEAQPALYLSIEQSYVPGVTLHVRTDGPADALLDTVRKAVQELDPTLPLSHVYTMRQVIGISLWGQRMAATLLGIFAVLGLLLAAMGIYAAMSYSVRESHREIGIRMALGARKRQIIELIVGRSMKVVAAGLVLGFALALTGARLLTSLLYGIAPTDPLTLLGVGALLALVGLLASLAGARKGAAVPPAATLRTE